MNVEAFRLAIAQTLNGAAVAAFPLARHPVIVLADDSVFENYDYDVIAPAVRQAVSITLRARGWRPKRATRLVHDDQGHDLVFPRPASTLGSSPLDRLQDALAHEGDVAFATPTQAVLLLLTRCGEDELPDAQREELLLLVNELPANLDKVKDWCTGDGLRAFRAVESDLRARQAIGIVERRARTFSSRLPREDT